MTSQPNFGEAYYERVIRENGYDAHDFEGFHQDLASVAVGSLEKLFLCHKGLYDFRDSTDEKAILTGFGLSGVPHLGTLSQMYRIGILNNSGYRAEVVLGDLDAYNGKLTPLPTTREHAGKYKKFMHESGLLDPNTSRVRDQYSHPEITQTAYLLGRFATDETLEATEEDLHQFYADRGKVDAKMSFRRKQSLLLMMADFVHLGQTHPSVLVMLGIDEHKYVSAAQTVAGGIDPAVSGLREVNISSLYTPIIRGLSGYPKMSKSFPGSGITLDMPDTSIRDAIMTEPDTYSHWQDSVIVQIAQALGVDSDSKDNSLYTAASSKDSSWTDIKHAVGTKIIEYAKIWQAVQ